MLYPTRHDRSSFINLVRRILQVDLGLVRSGMLLGLLWGCTRAAATDAPQAPPPPPAVSVSEVISRELPNVLEFTGRLEASTHVDIRPRVSGYIGSVHFSEGARVKRGELLFRIDPRPFEAEVDRLAAELSRASAELDLAKQNHERGARLLEQRVIPAQEGDRLRSEALGAKANVEAAAAALARARLELDFTRVRSPISGRASRAMVQAGNLVSSTDLLTTVVAEDPIYAYFDADEQSFLEFGQKRDPAGGSAARSPVFMALIHEDNYPHEGQLDFLDNRLDARAGTIRARAVFSNRAAQFTPGLFARLALVTDKARPSILINERAVGTDLGKKFVLLLRADQTLEYRLVTLGSSYDELRVVRSGLERGDVIVVNGLSHVRSGMKVAPSVVAMTANPRPLTRFAAATLNGGDRLPADGN